MLCLCEGLGFYFELSNRKSDKMEMVENFEEIELILRAGLFRPQPCLYRSRLSSVNFLYYMINISVILTTAVK